MEETAIEKRKRDERKARKKAEKKIKFEKNHLCYGVNWNYCFCHKNSVFHP